MTVRKPFIVLVVLFATGAIGAFLTGEKNFYRLIYLCALLIPVTLIWAYFSVQGIGIRRGTRVFRQQVGSTFEERFVVENRSPFGKLWLEIRDKTDLPGSTGSRVVTFVSPRQERVYTSRVLLNQRGAFVLGPTEIHSGDPFGFFARKTNIPNDKTLLVNPYTVELEKFPSPPGHLSGGKALRRHAQETTPYAAGVREYMPGDSLSRIHWKTTAKRNILMSKEFEQDPQANIWLLLDCARDSHLIGIEQALPQEDRFLQGKPTGVQLPASTLEYAISSAASIAQYFIREGRGVGLACSTKSLVSIPPEHGDRQLNKILETLTFVKSDGDLPLNGLVRVMSDNLTKGNTVILVTTAEQKTIQLSIEILIQRGLHPVIVYVDPGSFVQKEIPLPLDFYTARGIPGRLVRYNADLRHSLESMD